MCRSAAEGGRRCSRVGCRTAAEVDERRRKAAERQRRYAARKKAQVPAITDPENPFKDWVSGQPIPAAEPVKSAPADADERARVEANFFSFMDELRSAQDAQK